MQMKFLHHLLIGFMVTRTGLYGKTTADLHWPAVRRLFRPGGRKEVRRGSKGHAGSRPGLPTPTDWGWADSVAAVRMPRPLWTGNEPVNHQSAYVMRRHTESD